MKGFFRKLLGLPPRDTTTAAVPVPWAPPASPSPAADSAPRETVAQAAPAPDPVPAADRRIASILVSLPTDRANPGSLIGLDERGSTVSGPWPVTGQADPDAAARAGNAARDPLLRFGDTPTGGYRLVDILPARVDPRGVAMFGATPVLRLRPLSGQAAMADSNGRTALLVHGGEPGPTDGSLRVSDEAMLALLALLPEDPASAKPAVTLLVEEIAVDRERRREGGYARIPASSSGYTVSGSGFRRYEDDGVWLLYYQQMYLYDAMAQVPFDDRCQPGDAYPFVDPFAAAAADPVTGDASQGLADLGFDVPGQQPDAAPLPFQGDIPSQAQPDPVSHDPAPWAAPDPSPSPPSSGSDWSPGGGAYDR